MPTTCAKCGAENVAGDAFCGGCGAFLEFAAQEAAEGPVDATGTPAGWGAATPAGGGAGAPAGGEAVMPTIVAAGAPPPAPSPTNAAASPSDAGPICAACGRANPAGRTFCISCGERLGEAPAMGAPGGGSAAPGKPAWDFPTMPVPVAAPAAGTATAEGSGARNRLPLVAGIVVVVAMLGGGGFVALGGLGGGTPGATASAGTASVPASGVPSVEPSTEPATAAPTPTPTPAPTPEPTPVPTIPPGPTVGIKITKAQSSSQLSAQRAPRYLHDGSPATTWKSAGDAFEGAWVELTFAPSAVTRLQVWTGWQRDEPLYFGNHRPQNVTLSFDGGDPIPLELKDVLGAQRVDIPPDLGIVKATRLRITIADVYPARKTTAGGSPTNQVAISEIRLFGVPASP